jgi:RNA polymerase sigma factor (sigma-70 family)
MFKNKEITALFESIRNRLSKSVGTIVRPDDIEDVVQETYVRVCQFEEGNSISYPNTFMFRTARNIALDHVKRAESVLTDSAQSDDDFDLNNLDGWDDEPYQRTAANNEFELFCKAVSTLPRQCRRTFVLKKVYGHSQRDIASRLNISESTVRKHVATGILRCGNYMSKHTDYGKKVTKKDSDLSNLGSKIGSIPMCYRDEG